MVILALGTLFGWMYSLKPLALGWRGLGELDNAVLGGLLLPFYGYVVQAGTVDVGVILALLPFGASAFVNLLATKTNFGHSFTCERITYPVLGCRAGIFLLIGYSHPKRNSPHSSGGQFTDLSSDYLGGIAIYPSTFPVSNGCGDGTPARSPNDRLVVDGWLLLPLLAGIIIHSPISSGGPFA
jgi:hypothetical protein